MKILQIAIGFEGGIGKLLLDYCVRLKDKISFEFLIGEYENGHYEKELTKQGFEIHHIRVGASEEEKKEVASKIFSNMHYDAVHLHGVCDYTFLKCAKDAGIKTRIVHSHNALTVMRSRNHLYAMLRGVYHNLYNAIYVTDCWACGIEAGKAMWGESAVRDNKVFIMPNAVDIESYSFNSDVGRIYRMKFGIKEDAVVIGSVGRLTYQKNQSYMIDILASILNKNENVVLLMIGEGELEQELKDKAAQLKVSDHICWLGNRNDVPKLLNVMNVFLLTSHYEGLPVVMIEAQANGLPCVVSDCVTKECDFLKENIYLPLTVSTKKWANSILNAAQNGRQENADRVLSECGLDLEKSAGIVLRQYQKVVK